MAQKVQHSEHLPLLLSFLENWLIGSGSVVKAFQSFELPSSVWLFYIPQLLVGLHRPEGIVFKQVLLRMASEHPQSLYYYLRVYLQSSREAYNKLNKLRQEQHHQQSFSRSHQGQSTSTVDGGDVFDIQFLLHL